MLTQKDKDNRNNLKKSKPLVYEKMIASDKKIRNGESIAIIQLQYNYQCNFHCQHCSIKGFQNQKNKRQLTIPDIKNIYEQADQLGLARTTITGGEPLLFNDLDQLVSAINPEKFWINCDTNGWLFTKEKAIHLKNIGIDRIQPSIDSLNPFLHDVFRGKKGAHERAMKAVDIALEIRLNVFVQTVVTKKRLYSKEFINYIKYFNDKGVSVFVSYAKPVGAWEGKFNNLITKKDMEYMESLEKKYNVFTHLTPAYDLNMGCPAGKNIISLTRNGDILICPYFHCSMGNIFKESLKNILDRCMKLKPFKKNTCLLAEDREFINKYLINKIYGKSLPVSYTEVFKDCDFE